jgi:hypothetical protein
VRRVAALAGVMLLSATSSSGQFQPQKVYVCQTMAFWCAFQAVPGVLDGTPCYCGTVLGPVYGISIDPGPLTDAPALPKPQTRNEEPAPRTPSRKEVEVAADDCYKGLGNCQGSFTRSAEANSSTANTIRGRARAPRTYEGTLAEGASRRISLPLDSGVFYRITGGCDADCDDLDLKLRLGVTVVNDDIEPDDTPVVVVLAKPGAAYSLEILMESCSAPLCGYTIEIEEP